jgi:hypothetical protein
LPITGYKKIGIKPHQDERHVEFMFFNHPHLNHSTQNGIVQQNKKPTHYLDSFFSWYHYIASIDENKKRPHIVLKGKR